VLLAAMAYVLLFPVCGQSLFGVKQTRPGPIAAASDWRDWGDRYVIGITAWISLPSFNLNAQINRSDHAGRVAGVAGDPTYKLNFR